MNKKNMLFRMAFAVVILMFCFQTAGLFSAASKKTIEKLAAECQAGKVKSCEKLAKIAMSDSSNCNLVDHIIE
jgi:hypothetical protein